MSDLKTAIAGKHVDDILVASISFRGEFEEIPVRFKALHEQVQPVISGQAICLFHGRDPDRGHHLEVCYPVTQAVDTGEITSRVLRGGEVIATTRHGPVDSPAAIWGEFFGFIRQNEIGVGEDPPRMVYLNDGDERRDSAETFEIELQLSPMLPVWLNSMADGLDRYAGEGIRQRVMGGSEALTWDCGASEIAGWIDGAMHRLDASVPDEATRRDIMKGCAHRYPRHRIDEMRAEYERSGRLDELLIVMRMDQSVRGLSWYEQPERVGNVIYVTKDPFDRESYLKTTDPVERRAAYCHCPFVRAAIRAGKPISATHCYCGSGWYNQLWEGILGGPVTVEIRRTVLQGDDCCSFAVHLPLESS